MAIYLGVNIDHIATLRQARGVDYPSVIDGALLCEKSGADSITIHLREDRRHIQDDDVVMLKQKLKSRINLEMAATDEMVNIASNIKPHSVCIVPEKRAELTTEGGLDVAGQITKISKLCNIMHNNNIITSLFIDSDFKQIDAAKKCGATVIEIHTGHYANDLSCFNQINKAVKYAHSIGLQVNAGHGLTMQNTKKIAQLTEIVELNIGHSIIARSIFIGLKQAVKEMKNLMLEARK